MRRTKVKGRARKKTTGMGGPSSKGFVASPFFSWRMPAPRTRASGSSYPIRPSSASRLKKVRDGLEARGEISFQYWWRESRRRDLKQSGEGRLTATERLEALRRRVAAKGDAASDVP